ncbi:hypothetical protein SNE40_002842 [Patella caerulea]|uniref:Reverse transcriptase domain-containing protein n=1 Tax=Patella caerulea TaxID=87958 RepID=A0AAN8K9D8_PATCE
MVLRSRKQNSTKCNYLSVDGTTLRDNPSILTGWASHFESVFKNNNDDRYNNEFFESVSSKIAELRSSYNPAGGNWRQFSCTPHEVDLICRKLNKAADINGVVYEHLIHGDRNLYEHLSNLFNNILRFNIIPSQWRHSVIIPIFKGGNKPKSDANSYRGISLTPTSCKIFEKILEPRIFNKTKLPDFPNRQQVAYQRGLSSIHASFNLQETIYHHLERSNKLHVAFLDSTKAFDSVWHNGLLLKLHEIDLDASLWSVVDNMYTNMTSCVRLNGDYSRNFTLQRGVRQGGVLSAKFYLLYINSLLNYISESRYGARVLNVSMGCPTQADDIAVASPTLYGLQNLLNICERYSS